MSRDGPVVAVARRVVPLAARRSTVRSSSSEVSGTANVPAVVRPVASVARTS
jgi:hypothetical protein